VNVLVTGGAGFIGSHLVERLLALGHCVVCLDNFDGYYAPEIKQTNLAASLTNPRFTLIAGDIRDAGLAGQLLRTDCDVLVHLAARPGVRRSLEEPNAYVQINVEGTITLLEAARLGRVRHVVFASSSSVYGRSPDVPFQEMESRLLPASPYGASKLAAEQFCNVFHDLYRIPVTCLRFFTVYGPRQRPDMAISRFTQCIIEGRPLPVYGDGTARRDYTYVDDVIDGVVRAIERPGGFEIYNLGTEETISLQSLIATLEASIGKQAVLSRHPDQPGDVPVTRASIARAARDLGYAPRTALDDGIRRYVAWLGERDAAPVTSVLGTADAGAGKEL
jgi:UDP-glucuronate 4-epimerase